MKPSALTPDNFDSNIPVLLTLAELARRWRCSVDKIRAMMKADKIPVVRIGARPRFRLEDIQEMEKPQTAAPKATETGTAATDSGNDETPPPAPGSPASAAPAPVAVAA